MAAAGRRARPRGRPRRGGGGEGVADDVYAAVSAFRDERDVLLGADRSVVLSGELHALRERLQEAGARPVTIVLVDTRGESVDEDVPYGPLDTMWRFDADMAARTMYPAVDPVASTSTVLEGAAGGGAFGHPATGAQADAALPRASFSRPGERRSEAAEAELATYRRGSRLEAFLIQPFHVAEPITKRPGEWIALADTLDGVRRIMDGAAGETDVGRLTYIGRLELEPGLVPGNGSEPEAN
ncbi:hypothetical protein [Paenibacillus sp. GYB003]|uniref:hypothetical protein n=1 Tax=Paenibacillus sp. GYB003 TaxID=2994392 RepID=UPI002F9624B9